MGLFYKISKTAQNIGQSVSKTASNIGSSANVAIQEQAELNELRSQINVINQELEVAYTQIGRKYVEYVLETSEMPGIDVSDTLKMIDPKMSKKWIWKSVLFSLKKKSNRRTFFGQRKKWKKNLLLKNLNLIRHLVWNFLHRKNMMKRLQLPEKN